MEVQRRTIQLTPCKTTTIRFIVPDTGSQTVGILVLPALGVRAKFYEPLLREFAAHGFASAVVDLQGQGESSVKASRKIDFGYKEILEEDIPNAIATFREISSTPIVVFGHSLGGQMGSLYIGSSGEQLRGLVLCTSCSVYYKGWKGLSQYRALIGTQFCMILSKVVGFFPGNLVGFGGVTGKTLIHDWASQARTGNYSVINSDVPWEANLSNVTIPILAVSLKHDFLAPDEAVTNLCRKMPNASLTRKLLDLPELNHFTWVQKPSSMLDIVIPWLLEISRKPHLSVK